MNPWDGINRRRHLRAEFPYTIHIYSEKGKPISTYTEDISTSGVRIVTQRHLDMSEPVDLKIYVANDFLRCKGKIVWVKEKESPVLDGVKFYSAGIEFSDLAKDDMEIVERCVLELEKKRKEKNTKGKR